jgi:hypothetical protein
MKAGYSIRFKNYAAVMVLAALCNSVVGQESVDKSTASRSWLKRVRIAAYPLSSQNAEEIVRQAQKSHVYGIEVDNDIPGRYESLLHPEAKLDAIKKVSVAAHAQGQKAFVYIAGFECISRDATLPHTLFKEHPEWLQRKITGEPAVFDTNAAFWIAKGEEDVWVSPYAEDWRRLYMSRVRQIAATGIDGIYVDIPYWMTHFTGWEDTWASFDDATVAAFLKETGLNARKDIKLGDFDDPGFRKWIDFRIRTITAFLAEIRQNAIEVNPDISIIPETYPGIEQEAVRVGADVYQIYPVVDAIAHEYEFGEGDDHTAAARTPFDWMMYQIGMRSFRAFAGDKPTWILNYSWDGAARVKPADAMQTLFMSELMAGANVWDARGHVMSGSNDMAERDVIYQWIAAHEDIFGKTRTPIGDIGVYFSDSTRNYYPTEFLKSYRGTLLMLLQSHRQFRIVTARNLKDFDGKVLVLPNVRVVNGEEAQLLRHYAESGGHVVIAGEVDSELGGMAGAVHLRTDAALQYLAEAAKDYGGTEVDPHSELLDAVSTADTSASITVTGTKNLVAHATKIDGVPYLFIANFEGIIAGERLTPIAQRDIRIEVPASLGESIHVLPFLGVETVLKGSKTGERVSFVIPRIERGAVVWFK